MADNQNIMDDFDFLNEPVEKQGAKLAEPEEGSGVNLTTISKYSPRKLAQDILDVLQELGGSQWILTQAKTDPRGYLELLKRILPRNLQLDGIEGLSITLIDTFGNKIQLDAAGSGTAQATSGDSPESGQLQIATGGNPDDQITIDLKEKFGP